MKKFSKDLDRYFVCRVIPTKAQKGGNIMTVKQLKKQLAAAIAMVVVSVVALSSSTYAWFVGNNTATANGLTIKAQSEAGILISHKHTTVGENVWASTASGTYTSAQALYPTSTADGSKWFHASAASLTASTATAGSMETLTIAETAASAEVDGKIGGGSATGKNYYIVDSFDLYTTGSSAANLRLSNIVVSNSSNSASFDSSIRLLVVCGSNKYVVAPVAGATTGYTVGVNPDGTEDPGTAVTAYTTAEMAATSGTTHYLADSVSIDKDNPTNVQVYMYFEGEDAQHFSNSFTGAGVKDYSVTLTFEADVTA